ncbi:MAG TPA: acyltransferase [Polyangiaceae bacterium]|nr:acyltransferase [Polyangiaceae bacterium]
MKEHFRSLDSLRGIAALQVVLYHLPAWWAALYGLQVVRNSGLMVNFFFVLSGFVLFHSYADRLATRGDVERFIALRVGRIYPVHFVFLLVFAGVEYLKVHAHGAGTVQHTVFHDNSLQAFVECLFLVHALGFSSHSGAFNFPSWSISTEFYTYLLFAIGVVSLPKRGFLALCAGLVALSFGLLLLRELNPTVASAVGEFHWWVRCICGFFLGCLTNAAYRALPQLKWPGVWSLAGVLALIAFLVIHWTPAQKLLILPISAFCVAALALAPQSSIVNASLTWRPFAWLGEVSYSLYMCHALVLWVARQACRSLLHAPDIIVDGATTARVSTSTGVLLSAAGLAGSLLLAWLAFTFVEKPGRERARELVAAWKTKTAAVEAPTPAT